MVQPYITIKKTIYNLERCDFCYKSAKKMKKNSILSVLRVDSTKKAVYISVE